MSVIPFRLTAGVAGGLLLTPSEGRHVRNDAGEIEALAVDLETLNCVRRPIEYEIVRVRTLLDNAAGAGLVTRAWSAVLAANHIHPVGQCRMATAPLVAGQTVTGMIEVVLKYGERDRLEHTLHRSFALTFKAASPREISIFRWSPI